MVEWNGYFEPRDCTKYAHDFFWPKCQGHPRSLVAHVSKLEQTETRGLCALRLYLITLTKAASILSSILSIPCSDKCTEWPKMTSNTKGSKVPHTHITMAHDSQISICFALRPAVFELHAILRQVHQMIWKPNSSNRAWKVPYICRP